MAGTLTSQGRTSARLAAVLLSVGLVALFIGTTADPAGSAPKSENPGQGDPCDGSTGNPCCDNEGASGGGNPQNGTPGNAVGCNDNGNNGNNGNGGATTTTAVVVDETTTTTEASTTTTVMSSGDDDDSGATTTTVMSSGDDDDDVPPVGDDDDTPPVGDDDDTPPVGDDDDTPPVGDDDDDTPPVGDDDDTPVVSDQTGDDDDTPPVGDDDDTPVADDDDTPAGDDDDDSGVPSVPGVDEPRTGETPDPVEVLDDTVTDDEVVTEVLGEVVDNAGETPRQAAPEELALTGSGSALFLTVAGLSLMALGFVLLAWSAVERRRAPRTA